MIQTQQLLFLHQSFGPVRGYSRELKQERKKKLSNFFINKASLLRTTLYK